MQAQMRRCSFNNANIFRRISLSFTLALGLIILGGENPFLIYHHHHSSCTSAPLVEAFSIFGSLNGLNSLTQKYSSLPPPPHSIESLAQKGAEVDSHLVNQIIENEKRIQQERQNIIQNASLEESERQIRRNILDPDAGVKTDFPNYSHLLRRSSFPLMNTGQVSSLTYRDADDLKEQSRIANVLEGKEPNAIDDGMPSFWLSSSEGVVSLKNYINFRTPFNIFSNFRAAKDPKITTKMIISHCQAQEIEWTLDKRVLPLYQVFDPVLRKFPYISTLVLQNVAFLSSQKDEQHFLSPSLFPNLKEILLVGKPMPSSNMELLKQAAHERSIKVIDQIQSEYH